MFLFRTARWTKRLSLIGRKFELKFGHKNLLKPSGFFLDSPFPMPRTGAFLGTLKTQMRTSETSNSKLTDARRCIANESVLNTLDISLRDPLYASALNL